MKITVSHYHLRSSDQLDSLVENRVLALQTQLHIDEARIRLERHHADSPAFSVHVHLVTPGPDVFAEQRDHTLRAAIEKVMSQVESKIESRSKKRHRRVQSNLHAPALLRMGRR